MPKFFLFLLLISRCFWREIGRHPILFRIEQLKRTSIIHNGYVFFNLIIAINWKSFYQFIDQMKNFSLEFIIGINLHIKFVFQTLFKWNLFWIHLGISRDSVHKRRATGGKQKAWRKHRKFELGRPPAMTKLGGKRIHSVRVRGGALKYRALRLEVGNFSWGSEGIDLLFLVYFKIEFEWILLTSILSCHQKDTYS